MAKTIIISESMQKELNDILSMTQFKFKSNIKKFLAELLEDPIGAMPDIIFTHNGLDKNKLIKSLVDNKVINKKMTIDDHDADGTPHKAKMIVRYSVPKERFNDRLDALYDVLFPDVPAKINEDGGGATSCSGVDGNGFGSGEFIQPMGGVQRHPGDPKQKTKKRNTVGGDAYSVEINEAVTGDDADKSAALYVYNEDGDHNWFILCARRANRKGDEEGGKWNPPMGHLHKGESIKDGAIRECLEESGIDFSKYKSEIRVNDHLKWGSNCILKLGDYVSPSVTIYDFKPGKGDEENSKFIWLPLEEIDTKTWAWTCGENAKKFIPGEIDLSESKKHKTKKKSKVVKNDKGEVVPETCTCGGHIGLYICGEPVYKCSECGKYYGTMPFPKNLDEKYEHDWKEGENEEDDDYPEVEMIGDKYNYRRNDGTIMFPNELFDYCGEYRYGVGVIQKGDRWNFVDVDGNLLSPYEWFDRCYQFHDGVGRVEKNDRDAFMNKYGNYIISRWFDDSRQFKDGYGLVRINNNWKYIDLDGHIYTSKPINHKQYR